MESIQLHYDVSGTDFTCAGEASGKIKKTLKELGFSASLTRRDFASVVVIGRTSSGSPRRIFASVTLGVIISATATSSAILSASASLAEPLDS